VIDKEKCFVLDDGSSHGCSELILAERWGNTGWSKKILRVKDIIAQKFVNAAMEIIASRFRDDVDYGARFPAEFRIIIGFCDVEFTHCVHRWIQNYVVEVLVRDVHSVHKEQIVSGSVPHDVNQLARLLQRVPARASGRINDT